MERRRRRSEPFALRINMRLALATARELRGGRALTFTELDVEQGNFGLARTIDPALSFGVTP
jgi:hypothetical protein